MNYREICSYCNSRWRWRSSHPIEDTDFYFPSTHTDVYPCRIMFVTVTEFSLNGSNYVMHFHTLVLSKCWFCSQVLPEFSLHIEEQDAAVWMQACDSCIGDVAFCCDPVHSFLSKVTVVSRSVATWLVMN